MANRTADTENFKVLYEHEKKRREQAEAQLEEANQKINMSAELIKEAVRKYENIYRKLLQFKDPDYKEEHLAEEIELVNSLIDSLQVKNDPIDESLEYCYKKLEKVSRSFTVVINQLNPKIKDEICVFYLVLRALDTIEDDPKLSADTKIILLKNFHLNIGNESYSHDDIGDEPDYVELMQNYCHVAKIFNKLEEKYQKIIEDITKKMADGMCEFIEMKGIQTLAEYDKYCHYVAGLVGIGLTHIFAASNLEDRKIMEMEDLANSMGLFLQKTNITRDYAEDVEKKRFFWPNELCSKFTDDYAGFLKNPSQKALDLLNSMVNDALRHFTQCVSYLKCLGDTTVFKFCAIPQLMALCTLELVFNNERVFSENVKISRAESIEIVSKCVNFEQFKFLIAKLVNNWKLKLNSNSELFDKTKIFLDQILLAL
ncbi:squalene synthase [Brachionus plicatilis]|uniref:Squalene synthase n=1 Tax=Brachionus plicatilis TaxID=10195 RepID=A0A3M7RBP9_BRAPC|nr:squalene synthase [Brachionus plicatilis]